MSAPANALTARTLHDDLMASLTLTEHTEGVWRAPYFAEGRGVAFGGQLLGQCIIAAARRMPNKRVNSVQTIFARGVKLGAPVDIVVEPMHEGRNVGSVTVSFVQDGRTCARSLVLLEVAEPDLVRHQIAMPEVPGPDPAKARPHPLTAPDTIIVGDVDITDATVTGPPTLQLWVRFPDTPAPSAYPESDALHRALLSHATDGWLIGTAMRPHVNLGQSMAHKEVSTGVLTQTLTFHSEVDAREWLLIDHEALFAGAGRAYGRGHVFTADGRLVASFVQEALLRNFPAGQDPRSKPQTSF